MVPDKKEIKNRKKKIFFPKPVRRKNCRSAAAAGKKAEAEVEFEFPGN